MMWGEGRMTLGNGDHLSGLFWKNQLVNGDYECLEASMTLKIKVRNPQWPAEIDNNVMDLEQVNQLDHIPEIHF